MMGETEVLALLDRLGVDYERVAHPAVFTYEEAEALVPLLPGVHTKNLFLRDGKGRRHFLVVVGSEARVDLRGLARALDVGKLGMASEERLLKHLGVTPGAVTLLGVVNTAPGAVELVIDSAVIAAGQPLHCHPLVNTSTLSIGWSGIEQLLESIGQSFVVREVPVRVDGT